MEENVFDISYKHILNSEVVNTHLHLEKMKNTPDALV